ncbi:ECF-type sigma factor [Urbifossiella limnaea]|uniref:RNA polymerase sigma factor n=1 Tax=Urbifossiella limnaea TaxID=2528023 RepID=A0A517XW59_9BACT|nr:ECF-type sigma factor [Urbifossiella limnaea]QDU21743.1 RNA polymerase sigma factor [Urbifossiella limnaea]
MSDVTRLLVAAQAGDRQAAAELLPLVYDELRRLAAARMAAEAPGHTLDATALVHEAYLRLVGGENRPTWEHRRQFVAAAAEAMRRILVDHARRARAEKRGGDRGRVPIDGLPAAATDPTDWAEVDDALGRLAALDAGAAAVVRLKVFGGASVEEAADLLGVSRATAYRDWAFARAWLRDALGRSEQISEKS